jgi:hypothetical protein
MKLEPRRRGSGKLGSPAHTTADATPTLNAAILAMRAGAALDELVGRSVLGLAQPGRPRGLSTTWDGARQVVAGLTKLGCYVQLQIHADRSVCQVMRVLEGAAVAKQLAHAEGAEPPEAVAKAAALACIQMQPHLD